MTEREVFTAALMKEGPTERAAFLNQACADDAALRQRVESLLAANQELGSFMDVPSSTASIAPAPLESVGAQIGPYKLLQQIGEGGMGTVFMAEQTKPVQRKVAIKLVKAGMDSRQVIARFEAERQALAVMDHANIARVIDAGTTETGRPYFVMELIRGVPITEYCDANHLAVPQRLELLVAVCEAVQHAHQKGIIHRDIKPSNVLVAEYDGRPVPKVIDFGVAKAIGQPLADSTLFTQFGQVIGTFEYMSPEQASFNQLDVDTRTDVYSLGVLLYELLAGITPLDKERLRTAGFDEILRIIREEEPLVPSVRLNSSESLPSIAANRGLDPKKLTGLVSGELDWVVMKCLEKQREKRYGSADQVADECRRFLTGEPMQARPITTIRRIWTWYRRNVELVAGAYSFFAFFVGGIIVVAMLGIMQFVVTRPQAADVGPMTGLAAEKLVILLLGVESGVAAYRGKRRGLWTALILFTAITVFSCWSCYLSIAISRDLSVAAFSSGLTLWPDTPEERNIYIRNSVIVFPLWCVIWNGLGLLLQAHALCSRPFNAPRGTLEIPGGITRGIGRITSRVAGCIY
jgi:serine/threonine protein kinase